MVPAMLLKSIFLTYVMSVAVASIDAQATQAPAPKPPPRVVAGIPLNNGKPVHDAKTWHEKRRPEILEMFETKQFGRAPGKPAGQTVEVHLDPDAALNGKARRKQVTIRFSKDESWPKIHLVMYLPRDAHRPVPLLLNISFGPPSSTVDGADLPPGEVWDPKTNTKIPAPKGREFGHID